MREFRKRHTLRRWIYSHTMVVVLIVIAVLVWQGVWGVFQKERQSAAALHEVRQREEKLEARTQELEARISRLQTPAGKEEEVREKFNVVKEGEEVVVFVDPTRSTNTPANNEHENVEGIWQRMLEWFTL